MFFLMLASWFNGDFERLRVLDWRRGFCEPKAEIVDLADLPQEEARLSFLTDFLRFDPAFSLRNDFLELLRERPRLEARDLRLDLERADFMLLRLLERLSFF